MGCSFLSSTRTGGGGGGGGQQVVGAGNPVTKAENKNIKVLYLFYRPAPATAFRVKKRNVPRPPTAISNSQVGSGHEISRS